MNYAFAVQDYNHRNISLPITALENSLGMTALAVDAQLLNITFTEEYTTAQTSTTLITPPSGYMIGVRSVSTNTDATTGEIHLDFETSGIKVHRHYVSQSDAQVDVVGDLVGAVDEPLSLTTDTGNQKVFVIVVYLLHK